MEKKFLVITKTKLVIATLESLKDITLSLKAHRIDYTVLEV